MRNLLISIPVLLRGETQTISHWVRRTEVARILLFIGVIIIGSASYGAAMGVWRDTLQGYYTAAKFPLVVLVTTMGNALLNGMLAPLLGLKIGFRQSLLVILMSFTIATAILGALSPLAFFLVWNIPPVTATGTSLSSHSVMLLTHVGAIAFAGIAANVRLLQFLHHLSGSKAVAWKILFAWLTGNLFLGGQLSWILRPFVGSPGLPVELLRADALHGNFYEAVFRAVKHLLF